MRANISDKPVRQAGRRRGVLFSDKTVRQESKKFQIFLIRLSYQTLLAEICLISKGQNSFLNDKLSFNDNLGKVDCTVDRKIYTSLKKIYIYIYYKITLPIASSQSIT